jgi:hypothetical protein
VEGTHEDAKTTEEDREPQVEVLEDRREDCPVLLEVEHAAGWRTSRRLAANGAR